MFSKQMSAVKGGQERVARGAMGQEVTNKRVGDCLQKRPLVHTPLQTSHSNCRHAVERVRAAARRAGGGDAGEHGAHQGAPPNTSRAAAAERSVCYGGRRWSAARSIRRDASRRWFDTSHARGRVTAPDAWLLCSHAAVQQEYTLQPTVQSTTAGDAADSRVCGRDACRAAVAGGRATARRAIVSIAILTNATEP